MRRAVFKISSTKLIAGQDMTARVPGRRLPRRGAARRETVPRMTIRVTRGLRRMPKKAPAGVKRLKC